MDAGAAPMIAPSTLAVAEILSAVKMNGSAAGTRKRQRMLQELAAYDSISWTARGSGDLRPRRVLIVTGKKVRYAAITATDCQPCTPFEPRPITTIGAIARIGTVCEPTTKG